MNELSEYLDYISHTYQDVFDHALAVYNKLYQRDSINQAYFKKDNKIHYFHTVMFDVKKDDLDDTILKLIDKIIQETDYKILFGKKILITEHPKLKTYYKVSFSYAEINNPKFQCLSEDLGDRL